jgi:hypothetical protein
MSLATIEAMFYFACVYGAALLLIYGLVTWRRKR